MMNFRTTSVATAMIVFLTSFTPSQAFQVPVPMPAGGFDRQCRAGAVP